MVNKIIRLVIDDLKLKVREISQIVKISTERVQNILYNHLDMRKLYARWVPRVLTGKQNLEKDNAS